MNWKDLEGNGSSLIDLLPKNFSGLSQENQKNPQSEHQARQLRFELSSYQIQVLRVNVTPPTFNI
jgi:hypothetical protein